MATTIHWLTGAALMAGVLMTSSPSFAQASKPWVDPPSENGATQSEPRPNAVESKPALPSITPSASQSEKKAVSTDVQQTAEPAQKPAVKRGPRKAVAEKKTRRFTREASASPRASQRQRLTRGEQVRRGLDSGLELMTLRTIEYPDGRRVQILTRPNPAAVSEFMETRR